MADRIVVMHDGIVEQVGAPLDLYNAPANLFVAGFIGSPAMNLVEGTLRIEDGVPMFHGYEGLRLPIDGVPAGAADMRLVLGIRPEHLQVAADGTACEVGVVEPTGSETFVAVRADGRQLGCLLRDRSMPRPGEILRLRPEPGACHFFDAATGERL